MNKVQQAEQKKVLGIVNALQKSIRFWGNVGMMIKGQEFTNTMLYVLHSGSEWLEWKSGISSGLFKNARPQIPEEVGAIKKILKYVCKYEGSTSSVVHPDPDLKLFAS